MSLFIKGDITVEELQSAMLIFKGHEIIELLNHGDLIDINELSNAMYHEAFQTDSDMQKWDSGCWIRYKMFEKHRDLAPVIIPAERSEDND